MQKHLNAFTIAKNAQKCNWIVFIFEIFIHVSKLTQQFNRFKKKVIGYLSLNLAMNLPVNELIEAIHVYSYKILIIQLFANF